MDSLHVGLDISQARYVGRHRCGFWLAETTFVQNSSFCEVCALKLHELIEVRPRVGKAFQNSVTTDTRLKISLKASNNSLLTATASTRLLSTIASTRIRRIVAGGGILHDAAGRPEITQISVCSVQ